MVSKDSPHSTLALPWVCAVGASTLAGLGFDLKPVRAAAAKLKIKGAREVTSICPYCAVGCAQIVSVRQGEIVNIEGHPDSPINRGTLCPNGSAAFQLAVNPNRLTKVKYDVSDKIERPFILIGRS